MSVILQDSCWVVHIPFVRMVKLQFPAHLPVDHLAYRVLLYIYNAYGNNCVCVIYKETWRILYYLILYFFCANFLHSLIM